MKITQDIRDMAARNELVELTSAAADKQQFQNLSRTPARRGRVNAIWNLDL